ILREGDSSNLSRNGETGPPGACVCSLTTRQRQKLLRHKRLRPGGLPAGRQFLGALHEPESEWIVTLPVACNHGTVTWHPSSRAARGDPTPDRGRDQCGQATKGVWGMSWRQEAMKGVEDCDKPGGAVKRALMPGSPNYPALNP